MVNVSDCLAWALEGLGVGIPDGGSNSGISGNKGLMMKKYKHKPTVIEAVQWDGKFLDEMYPLTFFREHNQDWHYKQQTNLAIKTLEGYMVASVGDYIVKGVAGEFYPVKQELFSQLYEPATDE